MTAFLFRKVWKNKWLMLSLLVGNILLIGIVSATPLYTQATMQRILQQDLRQHGQDTFSPPAAVSLRYIFNNVRHDQILPVYWDTNNMHAPNIPQTLDVNYAFSIQVHTMNGWHLLPLDERGDWAHVRALDILGLADFANQVVLTQGRLPADYLVDGNIIEVIATDAALIRHDLLLGEILEVRNVNTQTQLYVRIVGIYDLPAEGSLYWAALEFNHLHSMLMSDTLLIERFVNNYIPSYRISAEWHYILDYTDISSRRVSHYLDVIAYFTGRFNDGNIWYFSENFSQTITAHSQRANQLGITLWVLQVPVYVLLAFYIYMVSQRVLQMEANDISVLKSRGVSRFQLLGLYFMQGLLVAVISLPMGLLLGMGLCHMLGASSGFLNLVQRAALPVVMTPTAILYAGMAMLLSFITMMVPVVGYSRVTIVEHKQNKRSRSGKKPLWQRFFLDFLCFGVALYGLFTFNHRQELMALTMRDTQSIDPLLFASSSLFIIGLGLICLRVFPYIIKLIFMLGRRFWSPSLYVSLLKIVRSAGEAQFIMIFLIITLAVGIFSAQAARTVNLNNDHQIYYLSGADVVFSELWQDNTPSPAFAPGGPMSSPADIPPPAPAQIVFIEPDFERFNHFEEVAALTRVQRQEISVTAGGSVVSDVQLMAIETNTFGETAWLRDDLMFLHANYFLNVLAIHPEGVLLSDNFRSILGYSLGDSIVLENEFGHTTRGEVVGFVERWPGFAPVARERLETGEIVNLHQHLVVGNLGHLQTLWGVLPYQVWMRTYTESNRFFYDFQQAHNLVLTAFTDANAAVIESRSHPILQGTNGVLTMGFIVILLICFAGFLIYWILSIRSRILQFGIFRAMGMSASSLVGQLISEQFFITFVAIAIGIGVGEISARLFVPLIQVSFTAADQVIPLMVVTDTRDYMNLYIVVGGMISLSLIILGIYVSRIKVAQVLRLGED